MAKAEETDSGEIDDELPADEAAGELVDIAVDDDSNELDGDDSASTGLAEPEPEYESLRDALKSRGLEVDGDDDEAVLGSIIQQRQQFDQQRQQWAQQQQQWQQWAAEQQARQNWAYQQQQQAAWQAQQQQARREYQGHLAAWNKVPDYDPQWAEFLTTDEQGNVVVKPGGDPTLPQKLASRREWERNALQSMIAKPVEFIQDAVFQNPVFHQYVQGAVQHAVQQTQQQMHQVMAHERQQTLEAQQVTQEVTKFALDKTGNLTLAGKLYFQAVQDLSLDPRFANASPRVQDQAARQRIMPLLDQANAAQQQQPASQVATPRENGAAKRIGLLKQRATSNTGRGGSLPKTERSVPTQDRRLSISERLKRDFELAGIGGGE